MNVEIYGGHGSSYPDPDKQGVLAFKDGMVSVGIIDDFDTDSFFDMEIYKTALESIIEEYPDDPVYKELMEHFDKYE